jgi:archaetidylinositol phosphate synthase
MRKTHILSEECGKNILQQFEKSSYFWVPFGTADLTLFEMSMDSQPHVRINDILLGPLERRALEWFAARMPAWVTPDRLTTLGVLSAVLILVSYWLTNESPGFLWLASFGIVVHWFADSLDGTLARYRHIERPKYGYFIDHTTDALSETLIGIGVGLSPYVRFDFAMIALASYLLMSVLVFIKMHLTGVFQISFSKFGPTEVRVFIILCNTIIFFVGNPTFETPLGTWTIYDAFAAFFAVALFGLFIVMLLLEASRLRSTEHPQS